MTTTRKVVRRFDLGQLRKVQETQQGYLKSPAYATRAGVFHYRKPDGTVYRELRHPDEIFRPESLETLKAIPLTNEHPPDGLLNPANTKNYMVGVTGEQIERDDDFVCVDVVVMDKDAIRAVKDGKLELSCGYECELDETPGNYDGEDYDCIQRLIVYNHLAIVSKGRAGPNVRLRVDSADAAQCNYETGNGADSDKNLNQKGRTMDESVKIGGKEFKVPPELAELIEEMQSKLESAQGQMDAFGKMKDEYDKLKKDYDDKMKVGENANQENGKKDDDKKDKFGQDPKGEGRGESTGKAPADGGESNSAKDPQSGGKDEGVEKMKAKMDTLQAENDRLKATKNDSANFNERYKARRKLEILAHRTLTSEVVAKLDSMSEREIKCAIIVAEQPKSELKDKSDLYIDARFDAVAEMVGDDTQGRIGAAIVQQRVDGSVDEVEQARRKQTTDSQNAWKSKKQA